MSDDLSQNEAESAKETPASWSASIGGVLIFLGTGLSMVLQDWLAEAAMGAALLGLVLVMIGRKKPLLDNRELSD
jgi:hypothetical protein